jgi:hypothetical protein
MSALPKPANNTDALEDCWIPIGVAASAALSSATGRRSADREAQETIEGGPAEPAEVPGGLH